MGLRPENTDRSICKKEWSAINWYLLRILNTIRYDPPKTDRFGLLCRNSILKAITYYDILLNIIVLREQTKHA